LEFRNRRKLEITDTDNLKRSDEDRRDIDCIQTTLEDDNNAFQDIVVRYTPLFYALSADILGFSDREQIEDIVQEIFIRIYHSLDRFNQQQRFFPWAYTIALNHLRGIRRKKKQKIEVSYRDELLQSQGHRSLDPSDIAISHEAESAVKNALASLKRVYREVFVLRIMQGVSVSETAEILHMPEGTVKTHLFRAKKQLRKKLELEQWKP
jgi:RNA polymerase sigma-70 factor (ECF subfamily)